MRHMLALSVSLVALTAAVPALAQQGSTPPNAQQTPPPTDADAPAGSDSAPLPGADAVAPPPAAPDTAAPDTATTGDEIVVTGIRASLARAAEIKRSAPQVVDSIVAQDIGKFPDPTTAAALQRVPGVQVTVGGNNEIVNPLVRGLPDILTTLDGREIFTAEGRGFAFQDLPAEAVARVDVFKSNTANLIEGGVAGTIDLRLNKAFNYTEPTIALSGKLNYPSNAEKLGPQVSFLATDRWDTGIGEIGALINVSWYDIPYNRPYNYVADRRSGAGGPQGASGLLLPISTGGLNEYGRYQRPQANASLQWQASPALEVYVDGLYSAYRSKFTTGFYEYRLGTATSVTGVDPSDNCFTARVASDGFNPNATTPASQITQQNLCAFNAATFNDLEAFTSTQAHDNRTDTWLAAGGFRFDQGPAKANVDLSYERSITNNANFIVDIGKRVPSVTLGLTNGDQTAAVAAPNNPMADPAGYTFINALFQDYSRASGGLFAAKADASYELGTIVKTIEVGGRYADRTANFQQVQLGISPPGGSFATPITATELPLERAPGIPQINNGAPFLLPSRDYLLSSAGQESLRAFFGAPAGQPAFQPTRRFDVAEKSYAAYAQAGYEVPFGDGPVVLDGRVGVRLSKTDREISGTGEVSGAPVTSTSRTSDTDWLPNASARLQLGGGLQLRATYARTLARPAFGSLNPGLNYIVSTNPNIRNSGSGGNPLLRPQKSDSYDATFEYYWKDGYIAIAGYYRDISDRVLNATTAEVIEGVTYNISRPRNVGTAKLKGIEASAQTFFSFLPGDLAGFGAFGNFTLADSEVGGDDPLAGYALQGVSKYNFNAGLLYDRKGISARVVYTYRSSYFDEDRTGTGDVRPIDTPVWLNYVRPNGRLDFSLGYDVTKNVTVTVEGSNILRSRYRSYINEDYLWRDTRTDDSLYAVSVRTRF
ncbi:TonB-dependent receptor [Sphingomonas sp. RRHST34]|uniref:TonB-dependent receptor n=1 Tax=Sphingomonas citri TaxID=2862499 RepID=A0ABS7BNN3_9SPHN|nr:TonB-dependent receptor [Sphingomonas citri]MBW6531158.1 TonB-dependent receptor [Sphingomonas citri]